MFYPPLSMLDGMAGIALIPVSVKVLGHDPQLYYEIAREVFRLGFAALLSPEAD
jgi:hypothetical protein